MHYYCDSTRDLSLFRMFPAGRKIADALIDESRMQYVRYVPDINLTRDETLFFAESRREFIDRTVS